MRGRDTVSDEQSAPRPIGPVARRCAVAGCAAAHADREAVDTARQQAASFRAAPTSPSHAVVWTLPTQQLGSGDTGPTERNPHQFNRVVWTVPPTHNEPHFASEYVDARHGRVFAHYVSLGRPDSAVPLLAIENRNRKRIPPQADRPRQRLGTPMAAACVSNGLTAAYSIGRRMGSQLE